VGLGFGEQEGRLPILQPETADPSQSHMHRPDPLTRRQTGPTRQLRARHVCSELRRFAVVLLPVDRYTWSYVKDDGGSSGSDCAWIDDIRCYSE
jgi:hypothetical protein